MPILPPKFWLPCSKLVTQITGKSFFVLKKISDDTGSKVLLFGTRHLGSDVLLFCVCVFVSVFFSGSVAFLFVLSCCSPDSANDFETIRCAANGQ